MPKSDTFGASEEKELLPEDIAQENMLLRLYLAELNTAFLSDDSNSKEEIVKLMNELQRSENILLEKNNEINALKRELQDQVSRAKEFELQANDAKKEAIHCSIEMLSVIPCFISPHSLFHCTLVNPTPPLLLWRLAA